MTPGLRRSFATIMLGMVLAVSAAGILGAPKPAYAVFGVADASTTIGDTPRFIEWIKQALTKLGESALMASISTALINTMTYAADRLAYDAAVFIASGGDGDDPLFENRTVGEYFTDYGASVAADALGQIDNTGILGNFSLCEPDIDITLAFKFGIQGAFDRPEPQCDFNEVKENWSGFLQDVSTTLQDPTEKNSLILTQLANAYNPKENDFSVGILTYSSVFSKARQDAILAAEREMFGGFFKDKTDFITGRVETPAELLQKRLDATTMASDEIRNKIAVQALGDKDILLQIGIHAGSVFTNTLLSKITEKIYNGIFNNLDQTDINPFDSYSYGLGNSDDARESYRSFLTATILSVQNYSLLEDFSACPYQGKGLYNCVADSSLVSAVARADGGAAMTIAEAIEDDYLHGSWPLIPSSDQARDQDIYCYTYGYCHGNLVKLRKARIISTGWELAAESTANSESSPVTLEEVVNGFYDCNEQNELDDNHPWCHLIDPNWVLKYPETQCRNEAYGEILTTSVSDERQTSCVDMPSCIDEDSNGTCTGGYGYCVREENVWDFRGEECPDYYGSCTTYQNPDGEEVYFLSNTTDAGVCTVDSAGCMWYQTQKDDADGDGTYDWPDYSDSAVFAAAEAEDDIYKNRIYFTSAIEDCTADDAGCRELVGRTDGTTFNMIQNPSFEDDDDSDGVPDGWFIAGTVDEYSTDGESSLSGTDAVHPGSGYYYQPAIVLTQSAEYTFSFYAAQNTGTASTNAFITFIASNDEVMDLRGYNLDGDCTIGTGNDSVEIVKTPSSTSYERYSCTFTVPALVDASADVLAYVDFTGDLWFEDVQLEQESSASSFHEGYSSSTLDLSYVKVPPTYLGCTGTDEDPEECDDYAGICSQTDVGCTLYSPTNGDPSVSGIASELDACPETCVGYDTFKQEITRYEPEGDFPVYFIPDSAEECSAQYVGCDEFTDISSEDPSYFTYIRACITPDQAGSGTASDTSAVYYTWEGSDTAGYQIKEWNLLVSDMGASSYTYAGSLGTDTDPDLAPCTSWEATDSGITCNDDSVTSGTLDADTADCDAHDDTITNPDCREFYDSEGNIHYREWTDTVTVNDACVTYRKTDLIGLNEDIDGDGTDDGEANCEGSGGYFDSTTSTCRYYGYADESNTCPEKESGCREYTGGRSRNSRQAFVEYFEDGSLENWDAPSATDVTLSNESIATDGHSLLSDDQPVWTYVGGDGTTCATDDGCETTSSEGSFGTTCTLANGETYCGTLSDDLYSGKTYTVSFWAKGTGTLSVGFDTSRTSGTAAIDAGFATGTDAITLESDWHEYSYGPLNMDAATHPDFGDGATALVFTPASGTAFYLDNVVLREGEDNINVIKDSWVTPAECDETEEGVSSPQYMLGCQEYTDQNGDTSYLKSFSSLCDEDRVGCAAYFMTQESESTAGAVYGAHCNTLDRLPADEATSCYYEQSGGTYDTTSEFLCTIGVGYSYCEFDLDWYAPASELPDHISYASSTVVSPADKDIFLVVNDDVECSSDVAGCMEVGLPTFNQDHTAVDSFSSVYLMNTPADYADTLCSEEELFCDAWTDNDGTTSYFKDPQNQTCEYRSDVTIDYVTYSGWFKTDTDEPCDPDYVIGGDAAGIWRNGDVAYAGWVGVCVDKYDTCSEFQDISDLETDELYGDADGTSYYYLNNDALEENSLPDSQKCNGEVSQTDGCGLFNDTSDPAKTSNASATYTASSHADDLYGAQQNDLVDPIDCDGDATDTTITTPDGSTVDLCANRCWYLAADYYDINGSTDTYVYDGSCYEDADCRPLTSESGAIVTGFCAASYSGVDAPRLENDSNVSLKVNRDRECAEWLAPFGSVSTWDERTNSFVNITEEIGLCTRYSGTSDASFCSQWKEDGSAVPLTMDLYSSRDVSWYGEDYSGYSIPGLLPVDQLTQVNTAVPLVCSDESPDTYSVGDECSDDADCGGTSGDDEYCTSNTESDYRLAYIAGSCDGYEYGDSCVVGYCENTGSGCVDTDACGVDGGTCVIGTCYSVSSTLCASSADCSTGETCLSGYCAVDEGGAAIEDYDSADTSTICATGQSFYESVNFKTGTCMYDQCILTPSGSTFNVGTAEEKACRAYPEANSPFGNELVTAWQDPSEPTLSVSPDSYDEDNQDASPISYVQNFENVQTCALGEDCSCLYKKVEYGEGSVIRYYGRDKDIDITSDGICIGALDGAFCTTSSDCVDGSVSGTCAFPDQVDDALGLEGYCLERDTSTNIWGDRDLNACLTWLPIDQLAGSTDLYAKYTSAGFFEDASYCSYVDEFENVSTLGGNNGSIFCAERDGSTSGFSSCVQENLLCPIGFYMIMGPYMSESTDDTAGTWTETCDELQADCPFVCVPNNSMNSSDQLCDIDSVKDRQDDPTNSTTIYAYAGIVTGSNYYTTPVYYYNSSQTFNTVVEDVKSCITYGRFKSNGDFAYQTAGGNDTSLEKYVSGYWGCESDSTGIDNCGWELRGGSYPSEDQDYLACRDILQLSDSANTNATAPYTDRLLNPSNNTTVFGSTSSTYADADNFAYTNETTYSPFGRVTATYFTKLDASDLLYDVRPPTIAACGTEGNVPNSFEGFPLLGSDGTFSCATGDSLPLVNDINNPEARSFVDFDGYTFYDVTTGTSATSVSASTLLENIFARSLYLSRYDDGVWDVTEGNFSQEDSDDAPDNNGGAMQEVADYTEDPVVDDPHGYDLSWDNRNTGTAPSVWAVDIGNCYGDNCGEDANHAVTINDQNEGDINADVFYRAYLKFYAAADKDQLPIRRVIVDWGDQTDNDDQYGSTSPDNFYKNHRGLEDGTETSLCEKPENETGYEWGMNSDSCDSNYFNYNHIYTCNPSHMVTTSGDPNFCEDTDGDGIFDNAPCTIDQNQCVFRPRVHVRDNWGWCTGTCTYGADGSDGCYDNDGTIESSDYSGGTSTRDECDYTHFPYSNTLIDPWVYFDGTITVTP